MKAKFIFIYCLLAVLYACSPGTSTKPIVTVSIEPQKFLLEKITGDAVEVRTLIANGANPETYDPSLSHVMNLNKSLGFLRMGNIGFETAMLDKIRQESPDLPIYNTSLGILPITDTHSHGDHTHESVDPHTWSSIKNAKIILRNMLDAMVEIDPTHTHTYTENYKAYAAHLDSLDTVISAQLAPIKGQAFIVWHPSLSYFARDYGLVQIAAGGGDNKEAAISSLRTAIDNAATMGARVIFRQKEFDSRQAETLSRQLDLKEVEINPLNPDWETEILTVANALSANE